jgi:hypothetical protein
MSSQSSLSEFGQSDFCLNLQLGSLVASSTSQQLSLLLAWFVIGGNDANLVLKKAIDQNNPDMSVKFSVSTVSDGSMKSTDQSYASVLPMRTAFLSKNDISPDDSTLVQVVYKGDDFCRYYSLADSDKGDGIVRPPTYAADALVVTRPDHALFLPLADCVGAVIHDPSKNILMLSHLGRHNLEQFGGTKCIEYLVNHHAVNPADLTVWLSPAAGSDNYPLYAFKNRSLHDVSVEQLTAAGVLPQNITLSPIDSAVDLNYFSHSQFLEGNRETDGRFAVVAQLA